MKIFISHSSRDKEIVRVFVDFLKDLDPSLQPFCTSMKNELNAGENFVNRITSGLIGSDVFIPIISEEYLASKFCLMELGAAWIQFADDRTNAMSLIIPAVLYPVPATALADTPLHEIQTIQLAEEEGLDNLVHRLYQLDIITHDADFYSELIRGYLDKIKNIRSVMNSENLVQRARPIAVSENGNPAASVLNADVAHNSFSWNYDLTANVEYTKVPDFVSFVLAYEKQLNISSAANAIGQDAAFKFSVDNYDNSVKSLAVEFKHGGTNRLIDGKTVSIQPGQNNCRIPFADMAPYGWDELQEICFVLKSGNVLAPKGNISISDIRIE